MSGHRDKRYARQIESVLIPQTSTRPRNQPLHLDAVNGVANWLLALDRHVHEHVAGVANCDYVL